MTVYYPCAEVVTWDHSQDTADEGVSFNPTEGTLARTLTMETLLDTWQPQYAYALFVTLLP